MRARIAATTAVLALALVGCGDDSESAEAGTEPGSATEPCGLLGPDDIEAAYGVPVGDGDQGHVQHDESGLEYTSTDCDWEDDDQLEVVLSISTADDFDDGLRCDPVAYLGEQGTALDVDGAGSATWLASEDPNEAEAQLRACTDEVVLTLGVDAATGTDLEQLRTASVSLVEKALGGL